MIALVVEINIKPGHKEEFMASMLGDARGSNNDEPGCLRFDVLEDNEDPNKLHLYEVYQDELAVEAHRNAAHFVKWREECKDWFATENVRKLATPVYPPEDKWVKRPPVD
ncbi:MAG: putative quinol monooxygenase [Chloroflexota bacterium]|nr:putative quinol monooxygenase [Chloroflexota bacterium]